MNIQRRSFFLSSSSKWIGVLLAGLTVIVATSRANASRMDMTIDLTGDWEPTRVYEVETLNNNYYDFGASFYLADAGSDQANVEQFGYRRRPFIDPWPYRDIDPIYSTELVPVGRSFAAGTHIEVNADAINNDDIEGFARIKHLTPMSDQTINISFDHYLQSDGSVFFVRLRMINEATGGPNLLPLEVVSFSQPWRNETPKIDTVVVSVDVQAGNSYTFEIEYDIYPSFVPEPTSLTLLGAAGLLLMRRK